ncbi:hypothetical protein BH23THE1_BH23THE1_08370 [soil metagenome]
MNRKMLDNTIEIQQRVYDDLTESQNISPTMDTEKIKEYIEIISEEIQQSKR